MIRSGRLIDEKRAAEATGAGREAGALAVMNDLKNGGRRDAGRRP
jgi:hypothetical protein